MSLSLKNKRIKLFNRFRWNISSAPFDKLRVTETPMMEKVFESFFNYQNVCHPELVEGCGGYVPSVFHIESGSVKHIHNVLVAQKENAKNSL